MDKYTKAVLTVIAFCMLALPVKAEEKIWYWMTSLKLFLFVFMMVPMTVVASTQSYVCNTPTKHGVPKWDNAPILIDFDLTRSPTIIRLRAGYEGDNFEQEVDVEIQGVLYAHWSGVNVVTTDSGSTYNYQTYSFMFDLTLSYAKVMSIVNLAPMDWTFPSGKQYSAHATEQEYFCTQL